MDRLELHLAGGYVVMLVLLGFMSCGFAPFVMWLVAIRHYPKALDREGVTLRNGDKVPWSALTEKRRVVVKAGSSKFVSGVQLKFGNKTAQIAPKALKEGAQVLPYLSRILGEDLARP